MNLRDLRYVCAVAELNHFGKAAAASHVSQPTLSGQIRKLEAYLGVDLFERTNKSVRLTPVGAEIVEVAREVLHGAEEIRRIAEARKDPAAGPLSLGLIPTIAPYLIPLFVEPLKARLPKLRPALVEAVTEALLARLEDGALDAAILATEPEGPRLGSMPLYREPFWLALPRGHRLAQAGRITVRQLNAENLLLLTDGHCFRDQALALCRRRGTAANAGRAADADMTATSLETILNLVGAGHGITLLPALAARGAWTGDLGVVARPLDLDEAFRTVRLVYRIGFPRQAILQQVAAVIRAALPDRVMPLD